MQPATSPLHSEVERRIGRNLLRYQLVELRLKMLLPLRQVTFSTEGIEQLKSKADKLRQTTLGQLFSFYNEQAEHTPADPARAQRISDFLDARNWLAHHLLGDSGMLRRNEDCRSCIERLDRDYENAALLATEVMHVARLTLKVLHGFLDAWVVAGADLHEGTHLADALSRQLNDESDISVSVTVQPASVAEILELTMRQLQRTYRDAEGWTHFNAVGRVAREQTPDLPRGLLAIARQVPGFEFSQRPKGQANASWMFRANAGP